ncbi:MAG TPA: CPBP family intramembrane glutamic endopeptidase [Ruminiclostridium sp.]|nr:CPBP family intramembrane glutamic endopeptidase [Ruminiclostridium sp.]
MYLASILNNWLWDKGAKTKSFYSGTSMSAFQAVFVIILAPVCEEVLFRGLLLPSMKPEYGVAWSVFYSSLIFGIFHIRPKVILPSFIAGIILGCLTIYSGSIIPAVISHCIYNLLSMNSYFKTSRKLKEYIGRTKGIT